MKFDSKQWTVLVGSVWKTWLLIGFLAPTLAWARNQYGYYPRCDEALNEWVLETIGSSTKSVEYFFSGETEVTQAMIYPKGCDGAIQVEFENNQAWCLGDEDLGKKFVFTSANILGNCK